MTLVRTARARVGSALAPEETFGTGLAELRIRLPDPPPGPSSRLPEGVGTGTLEMRVGGLVN